MNRLIKKGKYLMLAIDQRGSFKKMLGSSDRRKIINTKKEIIETIGTYASAVLLDPIYCKGLVKYTKKPVLFCMEKSGYTQKKGFRKTILQPNWSVRKAKKTGANAIKLNLFYNPDSPLNICSHQQKIARKIGNECYVNKIPFLLEILTYSPKKYNKTKAIIQSIEEFKKKEYRVDVFKLEYPGNAKACIQITQALGKKPWVLLSAGKPFRQFSKELRTAIKYKCSGFLAGRAVWQDGLKIRNDAKRSEWFAKEGVKHIKELINITLKRG